MVMSSSVFTHVLAALFGMGSWVTICGLSVELPLIVPQVPEGWYLPSIISVIVQAANVGPLLVTLMHRFRPGTLNETKLIYAIISFGVATSLLLAFFWSHRVVVGGAERSLPLLLLAFLIAMVDCTSSVTFLPYMARLRPEFLTSYYVGEGLSGLVPALVAMVQGAEVMECVDASNHSQRNQSGPEDLMVAYQHPATFSVEGYFGFLAAMMVVCLLAFWMLDRHPAVGRARPRDDRRDEADSMMGAGGAGKGTFSWLQVVYIYSILAWVNALTNTLLPAVQSYSCLPYGSQAYHWSAILANVANPVACFITMCSARRSLVLLGFLTALGSVIGVYILAMAVMSPCPPLVHQTTGAVLMVSAWFFLVFVLSFVKVIVAMMMRDEGHGALVWCGVAVQLGSLFGAVIMFPLVNVYGFFVSGDACNSNCL